MGLVAIVKATHSCNFACEYCYVDENAEKGKMSEETLENTIEQVIFVSRLKGSNASFIWHGGEPLTVPLSFYAKAIELEKIHEYSLNAHAHLNTSKGTKTIYRNINSKIRNSIQTNGSLITDEVIDFCKEHHISIGTSIDGPEDINNLTRITKNGEGTYAKIMQGLNKSKEAGVGGGGITILTKKNIDRIAELYEFYTSNNIHAKVNPLIKSGCALSNYNDLSITPIQYGNAMIQLFDLWYNDKDTKIDISPLSEIIGNITSQTTMSCNFGTNCQDSFISIGPQGDVYPCGRFDGLPGFKLGNINTDNLNDMLNSDLRNKLFSRSPKTVKGCEDCDYTPICNSGCMHNAYMVNGDIFTKDYYCASYKMMFKHIEDVLKPELEKARINTISAAQL